MPDKVESSPRIPKARSDLDQATRYLQGAKEILERGGINSVGLRNALDLMISRLGPGDHPLIPEPAGHITVMRGMAQKAREINQHYAATEIMKAAAVLRDRSPYTR